MRNKTWIVMGMALALAARAAEPQEQPSQIPAPPPASILEAPPATLDTPFEEPSPLIPETPAPALKTPTPSRVPAINSPPRQASSARSKAAPLPSDLSSGAAVIKEDRVNVRSRPLATSEVIAQLNEGDRVKVLENLTVDNPKPGEPASWAKIALPKTNYVWIHSKFIDPATRTVSASRLNVRAGPGENHGVLGRIEKGTPVQEVEVQGEWLKIQPPAGCYAFVASFLVNNSAAPEFAAKITPRPTPGTETVQSEQPPILNPTDAALPRPVEPAGSSADSSSIDVAESPLESTTASQQAEPRLVKRIVSREGVVRRSVSIQAPTEFVLENAETGKTVNYLYEPGRSDIVLRNYEGQRILVTGEELLDERWPKTPVMNIEKVRARP